MKFSNQTILFQGDSITDAGRNYELGDPNHIVAFGGGYANRIMGDLLAEHPEAGMKFYNRGVSGNRVSDLLARWRKDAIHLAPDWISILVGVNDTWHHFVRDTGTSLSLYEGVYRLLLSETLKERPGTRFILCEPFAFAVKEEQEPWLEDLYARAAAVRQLAQEFDAVFVPFQQRFNELLAKAPADFWLPDGVHPSPAGHFEMAALWRKSVGC